jgi:hypothetical protein
MVGHVLYPCEQKTSAETGRGRFGPAPAAKEEP